MSERFLRLPEVQRRVRAQIPRLVYVNRGVGFRHILMSGGSMGAIAPLKVILDFDRRSGKNAPGELQGDGTCALIVKVLDNFVVNGQCPSANPDSRFAHRLYGLRVSELADKRDAETKKRLRVQSCWFSSFLH